MYKGDFERTHSTNAQGTKDKEPHQSKWDQHPSSITMYNAEAHRSVNPDEVPFNVEAEDVSKPSLPWSTLHTPRTPDTLTELAHPMSGTSTTRRTTTRRTRPQRHYKAFASTSFTRSWWIPIDYPHIVSRRTQAETAQQSSSGSEPVLPTRTSSSGSQDTEWESAAKHGFRCTFDRRALRLHFWFKKARFIQSK